MQVLFTKRDLHTVGSEWPCPCHWGFCTFSLCVLTSFKTFSAYHMHRVLGLSRTWLRCGAGHSRVELSQ